MIWRRATMSWVALVCFAVLALACGADERKEAADAAEDAATAAGEAAADAAATAKDAAADVADAAGEVADDAVEATRDAADAAADAAEGAAEAVTGAAAVTLCKELAAKSEWINAVDVCTKAHEAAPDDMAVEHALQQAQAAAKAGS
jgi:hypothetical protein